MPGYLPDSVTNVRDDAAALDLLRRRIVNVVGHELRTPVTTLRGLADLLGTTGGDPDATERLFDAIRRTARRAEALVDDLLVAAGVTTALPVAAIVPTPVTVAATAAWAEVEDVQGIDLELDADRDLAVLARPGSLRRALAAILENAVRYGSPPVALHAGRDGADVVVSVEDAGPGVPEAERTLVLEPFFRGEQAVTTAAGLGLGLALAAALVEHDGGTLVVGGRDGGGTTVTIRLPAP